MNADAKILDDSSRLILHRTPLEDIKKGISIMTEGEGARVIDKEGKRYLDMVAGITRPAHIGYGREEVARAAYDQMCRLHYFSPGGFANEPAMELHLRIGALCNDSMLTREGDECCSRQCTG